MIHILDLFKIIMGLSSISITILLAVLIYKIIQLITSWLVLSKRIEKLTNLNEILHLIRKLKK